VSHLHFPDGVLPLWLITVGWLATMAAVGAASRALRRAGRAQSAVPVIGVVAALVIASMSTEIVPIAYHVNLTVLAGIIVGPWASILVALVVNVILALFGHGGVTVIGLNTVEIATEMILGYLLFHGALKAFHGRAGLSAATATVVTLFLTTTLMIGIVALSQVAPVDARDTGSLDPATLSFSNPFGGGLVANRIVTPERVAGETPAGAISVERFAVIVYALGVIGWAIEAVLIGSMVAFVARVRPGLLRHSLVEGAAWT
jgi:cobalt/nickel transport system permease protein